MMGRIQLTVGGTVPKWVSLSCIRRLNEMSLGSNIPPWYCLQAVAMSFFPDFPE